MRLTSLLSRAVVDCMTVRDMFGTCSITVRRELKNGVTVTYG